MTSTTNAVAIEQRLQRVEDRQLIQELGILYGFVMDERDEFGIRQIFTEDATLNSQDGVFKASGLEDIVTTYLGRFAALGPTNHYSHGHVVRFRDGDGDVDSAYGLLAGHAEVQRNGIGMQVALRYKDEYRRDGGAWKFSARLMSYMYYLPSTEYAEGFGAPDSMRAYGDRRPSEWPETLYLPTGSRWLHTYL